MLSAFTFPFTLLSSANTRAKLEMKIQKCVYEIVTKREKAVFRIRRQKYLELKLDILNFLQMTVRSVARVTSVACELCATL